MIPDLRPRFSVPARVRVPALVLLAAAGLAAGSCDKVPLTAPSNATIRLFASTPVVSLNGTAEITATVIQGGGVTVHNGTVVSFTTSLGTIVPSDAETKDGKCTVIFRAGTQSGTAVINAYSGGASTSGSTTTGGGTGTGGTTTPAAGSGVTLLVGAAAAASVIVTASPGTVSAAGGEATISATVFDANNNTLPGVAVSFSTDVGSVTPPSATTNQSGLASTTLSTYRTATVTAVAATSGANQIKGTATVTVNPLPTVTIGAPTTSPTAGIPASFQVTVAPGAATGTGGAVGAPITRATIAFGDGTTVDLGQPNGTTTVAHTYRTEGTYTVAVTATDASGQTARASVPVTVLAAQPFTLTVTASNGRIGQQISMTAIPTAGSGAPSVSTYTWDFGDNTPRVTTTVPVVSHTYQPGSIPAGFTSWTFTVQVQAVGSDGRLGFGSANVTITP